MKGFPDKKRADIIFEDSNFKRDLLGTIKLIRKIIKEEPLRGGSPTAQRLEGEAMQLTASKEATGMGFPHLPHTLSGAALYTYNALRNSFLKKSNNKFADIMLDPQSRSEIYKLVGNEKTKPTSRSILQKTGLHNLQNIIKGNESKE